MIKIPTKIESIEQLKEKAVNGCDCFILLNGCLRSSKHIWYDPECNDFEIIHMIDGSEEILTEKQLMDKEFSNIGHAMTKGALYKDD